MENQEMHQLTFQALCKAASVLSADELSVLCYHAGISVHDVLERDFDSQESSEDIIPEQTAKQRRESGERYCPKCFTFGHSHRKGCVYADQGMSKHISDALKKVPA